MKNGRRSERKRDIELGSASRKRPDPWPEYDSDVNTNITTPPQIVWTASGTPTVEACAAAAGSRCYVCGGTLERGLAVADWMGANWTDQNRARSPSSSHVCEACCYVHSRVSAVPGRPPKEGKAFGGNFRNYSHLADETGYLNASKGEKPVIRAFLARDHGGPWFAALADSGQKHVLPFAPMNGPGRAGVALFDEVRVPIPSDQSMVTECASLLTAGATKDELLSGDYSPRAWQLCESALVRFESTHGSHRGGAWFALAIWLAQRDEAEVAARQAAEKETSARRKGERKAANPDRGAAPRAARGVPRKPKLQRAEALGPDARTDASGGADDGEPRRVGHEDATRSEPIRSGQGKLPGFG